MALRELRELRIQACITQLELSEKIGVRQQTVSQWEKHKSAPRLDMVARLAKALRCSVMQVVACFIDINE